MGGSSKKKKNTDQTTVQQVLEKPAKGKAKKDSNWNGWKSFMNRASRGKFYKEDRDKHTAWKADQAQKEKKERDLALAPADVNPVDVVMTPTGTREEQADVRKQMVDYANQMADQNQKATAFGQREYGMERLEEMGSVPARMMRGLFRDTGNQEEDYEYNRTVGDFVPGLINGSSSGQKRESNIGSALASNEANMVALIMMPVLDELREVRDGVGYYNLAVTEFGKAKALLGKINSIQDILKAYTADAVVLNYVFSLARTTKEEFSELTMGMSLAVRDGGMALGEKIGTHNISSYMQSVGDQVRKEREEAARAAHAVIQNAPQEVQQTARTEIPRKRQAEYAELKANQRAFREEKGDSSIGDNAHRQAYMKLATKDKKRVNERQRSAMASWITSSGMYSEVLRSDESFEEMKAKKENKGDKAQVDFMSEMVGVMDSIFEDNAGLEENLETYRGVGDPFISYLFQQRGLSPKDYQKKDGHLDYAKIDKKGLLKKLIGMTYRDGCFVSTTTNRGYAAMWANQEAFREANDVRRQVLENTGMQEGSQEREALERYADAVLLEHAETAGKGGHMMIMNLPAGTKAVFADAMGSSQKDSSKMVGAPQNEVTLDRGLIYKITNVSGSNGNYRLYVTVVGQGQKKEAKKYDRSKETNAKGSAPAFESGIEDV